MTVSARRRATAFHEAGHAVVSVVERVPLTRVTIVEDGDALGSCGHMPWPTSVQPEYDGSSRTTARIRRQIRVLFAGVIAEAKSTGSKRWNLRGFHSDRVSIGDLALYVESGREDASAVCERERCNTEALVAEHWRAIVSVALALLEHESLSGRRVREIVRAAA